MSTCTCTNESSATADDPALAEAVESVTAAVTAKFEERIADFEARLAAATAPAAEDSDAGDESVEAEAVTAAGDVPDTVLATLEGRLAELEAVVASIIVEATPEAAEL